MKVKDLISVLENLPANSEVYRLVENGFVKVGEVVPWWGPESLKDRYLVVFENITTGSPDADRTCAFIGLE
jgi:hypothetical protein